MLRLLKKPGLKPTNIFPESQQRGDVFVEGGGAALLMAPSPPGFPTPTRRPRPRYGDTCNGHESGTGSSPPHQEKPFGPWWVFFSRSRLSLSDSASHRRWEVESILSAAQWEPRKTPPFRSCSLHRCRIHARVPGKCSRPAASSVFLWQASGQRGRRGWTCPDRCGHTRGSPCRVCVWIGVYVWTYVRVCAHIATQMCGCMWFGPPGWRPRLRARHPTGCREPWQGVVGVQHHPLLLADSKATLSPGQTSLLGLTSSPRSLLRVKAKGQGISLPGSNGEEEERREGWGSTSSSGDVCIASREVCIATRTFASFSSRGNK